MWRFCRQRGRSPHRLGRRPHWPKRRPSPSMVSRSTTRSAGELQRDRRQHKYGAGRSQPAAGVLTAHCQLIATPSAPTPSQSPTNTDCMSMLLKCVALTGCAFKAGGATHARQDTCRQADIRGMMASERAKCPWPVPATNLDHRYARCRRRNLSVNSICKCCCCAEPTRQQI